ncbi:PCYCGC motif-containing (lipo)protein [Lentibacillus halophilus]
MVFVSACSSGENNDKPTNKANTGDVRETTASVNELPSFLDAKSDDMKNLYTAVANSQDLLESIPCYCGCGEFGHTSNYDCFINQNKDDGSLVWDDHATKCQACLDIAAESVVEWNKGKSIKDIRKMIDEKYQEADYPEPTPTPEI